METVYLIKAALDGFLIGWGIYYLVCCARERPERAGKGGEK